MLVEHKGKKTAIKRFFHQLSNGESLDLGVRRICGVLLHVCAVRTKAGDLIILGSQGISGVEASEMYLRRWNIETGFSQLKTHGFNVESTRLRGAGKLDLLFSVLAISMAWCYSCGDASVRVVPIRLLRHGRLEQSVFRRGLDLLCSWFLGVDSVFRVLFRRLFAFFKRALSFVGSVFPAGALQRVVNRH